MATPEPTTPHRFVPLFTGGLGDMLFQLAAAHQTAQSATRATGVSHAASVSVLRSSSEYACPVGKAGIPVFPFPSQMFPGMHTPGQFSGSPVDSDVLVRDLPGAAAVDASVAAPNLGLASTPTLQRLCEDGVASLGHNHPWTVLIGAFLDQSFWLDGLEAFVADLFRGGLPPETTLRTWRRTSSGDPTVGLHLVRDAGDDASRIKLPSEWVARALDRVDPERRATVVLSVASGEPSVNGNDAQQTVMDNPVVASAMEALNGRKSIVLQGASSSTDLGCGDLFTLASCDAHVLSTTTFSIWAALLSPRARSGETKVVFCPETIAGTIAPGVTPPWANWIEEPLFPGWKLFRDTDLPQLDGERLASGTSWLDLLRAAVSAPETADIGAVNNRGCLKPAYISSAALTHSPGTLLLARESSLKDGDEIDESAFHMFAFEDPQGEPHLWPSRGRWSNYFSPETEDSCSRGEGITWAEMRQMLLVDVPTIRACIVARDYCDPLKLQTYIMATAPHDHEKRMKPIEGGWAGAREMIEQGKWVLVVVDEQVQEIQSTRATKSKSFPLHEAPPPPSEEARWPVIVVQQFYNDPHPDRAWEMERCLEMNLENELVDEVHTLLETGVEVPPKFRDHPRLRIFPDSARLTFRSAFEHAARHIPADRVVAVMNGDIYVMKGCDFGRWAQRASRDPHVAVCLTRWEESASFEIGIAHLQGDSADAWVFSTPGLHVPDADFRVGNELGCDGAIANRFLRAGYAVQNVPFDLRIVHVDRCAHRDRHERCIYSDTSNHSAESTIFPTERSFGGEMAVIPLDLHQGHVDGVLQDETLHSFDIRRQARSRVNALAVFHELACWFARHPTANMKPAKKVVWLSDIRASALTSAVQHRSQPRAIPTCPKD